MLCLINVALLFIIVIDYNTYVSILKELFFSSFLNIKDLKFENLLNLENIILLNSMMLLFLVVSVLFLDSVKFLYVSIFYWVLLTVFVLLNDIDKSKYFISSLPYVISWIMIFWSYKKQGKR